VVGVQAKVPVPPASSPSHKLAPPVIETQKSDHAVPDVPKTLKELPTIRLVVDAVVAKKLVVVAAVVVERVNSASELSVSLLKNCSAVKPSRVEATKADGTAPKIFLGLISPSHVGEPLEPPISTDKYKV